MGGYSRWSQRWTSSSNHLALHEVMEKTSPLVVNAMEMEADPQTTNGEVWTLIILVLLLKAPRDFCELLNMIQHLYGPQKACICVTWC